MEATVAVFLFEDGGFSNGDVYREWGGQDGFIASSLNRLMT